MCPVEAALDNQLVGITGTGWTELPIAPNPSTKLLYSGDETGLAAVIQDGKGVIGKFPLAVAGHVVSLSITQLEPSKLFGSNAVEETQHELTLKRT